MTMEQSRNTVDRICSHYGAEWISLIENAFAIALEALEGEQRSDGTPFVGHPVAVAQIVSEELGLMAEAVAAVFLHEASRVHSDILVQKKSGFPQDVIEMAVSLNKISGIKPKDTKLEADRYRKLIASYSTDPRVFLIKLADRLEIMRTLHTLTKADQVRKNAETILLYVPLAHQTGVYNIKAELENLWLKYAEPGMYREITNQLTATKADREAMMREFVEPLKARLTAEGIKYTLKARTKSAYSIWRKMKAQNIPFSKVYDVFAIRFIIEAPLEKEYDLCWHVYSLVTEQYEPDTSRLRDWLTVPKPNGYQSLHTTVRNARGHYVEVQIRTERMDYEAEIGAAAHWSYKGVKRENSLDDWLKRVHKMMEQPEGAIYEQFDDSLRQDVFVFTPEGELRQLKAGATVLDFAFDIHSNLGIRCTGAKIGSRMVSIKEKLNTGDVSEILTSKNQKPNQDWLNWVVTSKARSKIKQKLKDAENKLAADGRELLERRLKNWKLEIADDDLTALYKKYKYKTAHELYGAIGAGTVDVADIKAYLLEKQSAVTQSGFDPERAATSLSKASEGSEYLEIGNGSKLTGVDYRMAKCCNPVFGDEVFGFVTISAGIKIHRMSCPNASRLLERYPHRVQKVRWRENAGTASFQITLKVVIDDVLATNAVITAMSSYKASIRDFNTRNVKGDTEITAKLYVTNNLELDKITAALHRLHEVKQVTGI